MSSQEEKDKIAEQIIKREKEKHTIFGWLEEHKTLGGIISLAVSLGLFTGLMVIMVMIFGF